MIKRKIADLDLRQIAESGQCFRMTQKSEGVYTVSAFEKYLEIEQKGDLFFFSCAEKEFEEIWEDYL
ncbi:8-oxoguanine DNA glycosylase, N-terminal domain-containing protein, partial [Blautia pseudococcoides]|nr:8-oxoguanine DNA glycosylase, N-terminal domain-containing protein [Blautia pseudococcoides]